MTKPSDSFAAFVSPVAGRLVRRFGTSDNLGQIAGTADVDPSLVIPLTHEEWRRHQHEYLRAIGEESLKRRTAALEASQPAMTALYAVLSADQRAVFDRHAPGSRPPRGMGR